MVRCALERLQDRVLQLQVRVGELSGTACVGTSHQLSKVIDVLAEDGSLSYEGE
mgnify:CR=1 FL=1